MMTKGLVAVLIALSSVGRAAAQEAGTIERENGQLQLTLSQSPDRAEVARLELEVGLSDRLQFRAELPISAWPGEDLGIGLAYDFSREGRFSLGAGIELQPAEPSDLSLRFEGGVTFGRGEIHSELEVGVGGEREVVLELDAARGGVGVALPSASTSKPSLVLKTGFDF